MATPTKTRETANSASAKSTPAKVEKAIAPTRSTADKAVVPAKLGAKGTVATSTKPGAQKGTAAGSPAVKPAKTGKFFFGMMVYLLAAQVMQIGLIALDGHFGWGLGDTKRSTLFTLPLIGAVTPLSLIFIAILTGLLWALYKFNILPSNREMAAAAAAQRAARGNAGKAAPPAKPGVKGATSAKAVESAKGSATSRTASTLSKTPTKGATAGRPTTTKPLPTTVKGGKNVVPVVAANVNDDLYERAKAAQRAAVRKARKR